MTDKDAVPLKHKTGQTSPGYVHQSAIDSKCGVVCAVHTKNSPDHPDDLFPLVDAAKSSLSDSFQSVLADCGFGSYAVYEKMITEDREEEYYIPDERYSAKKDNKFLKGKYDLEHFKKDENGNRFCPQGHPMEYKRTDKKGDIYVNVYRCNNCQTCKCHDECTKKKFRELHIDVREKYQQYMRDKLETIKGGQLYSKRQGIVEPAHGDDQKNRGWIQHHLRGLQKAKGEFLLMRIGTNLRKIVKYGSGKLKQFG